MIIQLMILGCAVVIGVIAVLVLELSRAQKTINVLRHVVRRRGKIIKDLYTSDAKFSSQQNGEYEHE